MSKKTLTEKMAIDILSAIDGEDLLHKFPQLRRVKAMADYGGSLGGGFDRNKIIRYIVILYSADSFMNKKPVVPLQERQYKAADLAGFIRDQEGRFKEVVETSIFQLQDPKVFEMIFQYLMFQHNVLWREICTCEHELEEFHRLRMKPVVADDDKDIIAANEKKDKLWKGCQDRIKYLESCYSKFYNDDAEMKTHTKKAQKRNSVEDWAMENR
jgi:hypothetical protein